MNDFSEYSIRVGTDAGYYGSQCTDADALRIAADVAKLIAGEFPGGCLDRRFFGLGFDEHFLGDRRRRRGTRGLERETARHRRRGRTGPTQAIRLGQPFPRAEIAGPPPHPHPARPHRPHDG